MLIYCEWCGVVIKGDSYDYARGEDIIWELCDSCSARRNAEDELYRDMLDLIRQNYLNLERKYDDNL